LFHFASQGAKAPYNRENSLRKENGKAVDAPSSSS